MSVPNVMPPMPSTPPAAPPRNGLGTSGFVTGLVGLVFAFLPIIGIIAWPLVIVGLVLSIVGLLRVNKGAATNRGLSIAGIAVSAVGLLICIIWASAFGAAASAVNGRPDNASAPVGSASGGAAVMSNAQEAPSDTKQHAAKIGEPVVTGSSSSP